MSQIVCTQCGAEVRPEDVLYVDGEAVCPSCAETDTVVCSYCGERIWREDDFGDSDIPLCESCYDSHYPNVTPKFLKIIIAQKNGCKNPGINACRYSVYHRKNRGKQ